MPLPKANIHDLVDKQEYPPDVHAAVHKDIEEKGTASRIESGELVLPSLHDAVHWHDRNQVELGLKKLSDAPPETVKDLLDRITALEAAHTEPARNPEGL